MKILYNKMSIKKGISIQIIIIFGSKEKSKVSGFFVFSLAFLLFLAPVGGSNPPGLIV